MRTWLSAAVLIALPAAAAAAALPLRINFQGKLLDPSTNTPKNGSQTVVFNIYNAPTGAGGLLWGPETQTVTATNGVFSAQLGSVLALSPDVFANGQTYLGITVGSDSEMTPRQQLVMSPYSFASAELVQASNIRINAGTSYSTFTSAGNLLVPYGVDATTGAFSGNVTASSGNFTATGGTQFSLETSSGLVVDAGTLDVDGSGGADIQYGVTATTAIFSGSGPTVYSVTTSSGIDVKNGTLMIENNADAVGTAPQVAVTTGTTSTTIGTAATLIAGSQVDISPSSLTKLVVIRGSVSVVTVTAATNYTLTLSIHRATPGTCTAGSQTVQTLPAQGVDLASTAADYSLPFFWVDNPGSTSGVEYCLAALASTANKLKVTFLQIEASEGHNTD